MFKPFIVIASVAMIAALSACKSDPAATNSAPAATAVQAKPLPPFDTKSITSPVNPEEITLYDGSGKRVMSYLIPQIRTAARALGFGGMAQYAVLRGTRANLRLGSPQPRFLFAAPTNAQPESYLTVANFAVRENGTREVIIGGGFMSYSTGVHQDRIVPISIEKVSDQSKAPKGFILYTATPNAPLSAGEYAVIFYTSQIRTPGIFASALDSYFDFGVD